MAIHPAKVSEQPNIYIYQRKYSQYEACSFNSHSFKRQHAGARLSYMALYWRELILFPSFRNNVVYFKLFRNLEQNELPTFRNR